MSADKQSYVHMVCHATSLHHLHPQRTVGDGWHGHQKFHTCASRKGRTDLDLPGHGWKKVPHTAVCRWAQERKEEEWVMVSATQARVLHPELLVARPCVERSCR